MPSSSSITAAVETVHFSPIRLMFILSQLEGVHLVCYIDHVSTCQPVQVTCRTQPPRESRQYMNTLTQHVGTEVQTAVCHANHINHNTQRLSPWHLPRKTDSKTTTAVVLHDAHDRWRGVGRRRRLPVCCCCGCCPRCPPCSAIVENYIFATTAVTEGDGVGDNSSSLTAVKETSTVLGICC